MDVNNKFFKCKRLVICAQEPDNLQKALTLINGGFETNADNAKSISFPGVASTMMAYPDMETKGKILKATNEVRSFGILSGGGIGWYDANKAFLFYASLEIMKSPLLQ